MQSTVVKKKQTKLAWILAAVTVPPLLTLPIGFVLHLKGNEALAATIAVPGVAVLAALLVGLSLGRSLKSWAASLERGGEGVIYPRKGHWFRVPRPEPALQSYLDRRRY